MQSHRDAVAFNPEAEMRRIEREMHYATLTAPSIRDPANLEEYERYCQIQRDRRMAQSMMMANIRDAQAIDQVRREVEEEFDPASDDEEDAELRKLQAGPITDDIASLSKLAGAYVSANAGRIIIAHTEGARNADIKTSQLRPTNECIICGDAKMYYDSVKATCEHIYCRGCVKELFETALKDESLFPPRCCGNPIEIEKVKVFLNPTIEQTFNEKQIEYSTSNRTYCFYKPCSAFIPPNACNEDKRYARCQKCPRLTCLDCKQKHHGVRECKIDEEAQALLNIAEQAGWRRCGNCQTMVELNTGCNHITCKCGNEFCYVCGAAPWKSCECPQWQEEMLLERAEAVLQRQGFWEEAGNGDWDQALQEMADMLEENHDCAHERWRGCRGGDCDECGRHLPMYLYRCQRCHIEMCRRCRYNRQR